MSQVAVDASCRGDELDEQIAWTMGAINVAYGQLLAIARSAIAEGLAGGYGLRSPADWLAWRTGLSKQQCNTIVALARRADELPATIAAVTAGDLTLDQAAPIARHVPAVHEAAAAAFAKTATVNQLNRNLSRFNFDDPDDNDAEGSDAGTTEQEKTKAKATKGTEPHAQVRHDERGWHLDARLADADGAQFEQALTAAREDLYQQRKAETPEGAPVPPVTWADALNALADSYLAHGQAHHPGSDRFQVHLHLQAGTDGPVLANHLGLALAEADRRMALCDCTIRVTTWDGMNPLATGRKHRVITRRMRRAIEHRDGGCTAPGCTRTTGLHIHHLVHWEDGGATDPDNLLTLCNHHHRLHHEDRLDITRTCGLAPGQPGWITFSTPSGIVLPPTGTPSPQHRPPAPPSATAGASPADHDPHHQPLSPESPAHHAHAATAAIGLDATRYRCPTGQRHRSKDLTLDPVPPPPPPPPAPDGPARPRANPPTDPPRRPDGPAATSADPPNDERPRGTEPDPARGSAVRSDIPTSTARPIPRPDGAASPEAD